MHVILAEDIGPWLFAALLLFAGLGGTVLALIGIAPAIFAKRMLTLCLIAPALFVGLGATYWLGLCYYRAGTYDQEHFVENVLKPWFLMGGLPLITSLIVAIILFVRTRRRA
jgi:hypothetical protein